MTNAAAGDESATPPVGDVLAGAAEGVGLDRGILMPVLRNSVLIFVPMITLVGLMIATLYLDSAGGAPIPPELRLSDVATSGVAAGAAAGPVLGIEAMFAGGVIVALLAAVLALGVSHYVRLRRDRDTIALLKQRLAHAERMEALGQLTSGMAHDFNNMLAVVIGNVEILAEQVDDPELRAMAERALRAAERGSELTSRLLAIGRGRAASPVPLDVEDVVSTLSATLHRTLGDGIALKIAAEGGRRVLADRDLLDSALVNLALNARAAMPDGGILRISSKIAFAPMTLAGELAPGSYAKLSVSDTGIGMSPEVAERAFDPLATSAELGSAAAMRLAAVYGFARQSGGHAMAESLPGHGTSVHIYLPLAQASASAAAATIREPVASAAVPGGRSERVLLVEDDPSLRDQLSRQLSDLGYAVTEARSGVQALELLLASPDYDMLFTDVVMPGGVSGVDLAARARKLRPQLKVLLTSGYAGAPAPGATASGDPVLSKPYRRQQLAQALRSALDQAA